MSFLSFSFSPIWLSFISFIIFIHVNANKSSITVNIIALVIISFSICFGYPFTNIFITEKYFYFDKFIVFCLLSAAISMFINLIILYIYRIIISERTITK